MRLCAVLCGLVGLALLSSASAARAPALELLANAPKAKTINSDLAFWGSFAYQGNYEGFRVIDISKPGAPVVVADVHCHGPQNDVSVWGHLLFLSVDRPQTSPGCDSQDTPDPTDPTAFEGIRIFDVTDAQSPRLVASVPTDCGSHTNTLIPDLAHGRVLLYVSSYALRPGPHCGAGREANPLHGKISIVAVPLAAPETASVVATPDVSAPTFGGGSPEFAPTVGCHDISVFLPRHLAAAACMSEGQLWDISDPTAPRVLAHIQNPAVEFWHSATFSWNGKTVVFGDESLDGSCHTKNEPDGRLWFYSVAHPAKPLSSFLIARPGRLLQRPHVRPDPPPRTERARLGLVRRRGESDRLHRPEKAAPGGREGAARSGRVGRLLVRRDDLRQRHQPRARRVRAPRRHGQRGAQARTLESRHARAANPLVAPCREPF